MIVRRITKDVIRQIPPGDLEVMEEFYDDKLLGTPQEVQRDPSLIERWPYFPAGLLIHMVHRGYYRSMRLDSEDEFLNLLAEVNPEMSSYVDEALGFHAAFRQAQQAEHEWTQPFAEALRTKLPKGERIITDFNLLCETPKTKRDEQLSIFGGRYGLTQAEINRLKALLWPSQKTKNGDDSNLSNGPGTSNQGQVRGKESGIKNVSELIEANQTPIATTQPAEPATPASAQTGITKDMDLLFERRPTDSFL
ncbi:MAG: hypothetical protein Q7O04_04475 [Candidatus Omnitrophota bacterium]|nr:hypothetical protein [Candidatus Omnitrophota bacterium]